MRESQITMRRTEQQACLQGVYVQGLQLVF